MGWDTTQGKQSFSHFLQRVENVVSANQRTDRREFSLHASCAAGRKNGLAAFGRAKTTGQKNMEPWPQLWHFNLGSCDRARVTRAAIATKATGAAAVTEFWCGVFVWSNRTMSQCKGYLAAFV